MNSIQDFLGVILVLFNQVAIPFIAMAAFFFFIVNVFRYFILGGANPDAQEKARSLAIWGVAAFVVITSLWGMVNILVDTLNVGDNTPVRPDYIIDRTST